MKVSMGICAYNEEQNIGKLLARLVREPLLSEIIVVASGCTDRTVLIALSFKGVKVLTQEKRQGKASAVNLFIKEASGDVLVLESADTIPSQFCFKYLLEPFGDRSVGMVGAHPIPVNSTKTAMGRVGHLVWKGHHLLATIYPKAGEVVAFRNIVKKIDNKTLVDEAHIEHEITKLSYKVVYAPKAVIFNKTPETADDFLRQRSRIYLGHLMLRHSGYELFTMNRVAVTLNEIKLAGKDIATLLRCATLEYRARRLGLAQFRNSDKQTPSWDIATTTKELV